MKTVGDLVDELLKHGRDKALSVSVQWAGDTATADAGEVSLTERDGVVTVAGWMSGCDTELEVETDEDDEG